MKMMRVGVLLATTAAALLCAATAQASVVFNLPSVNFSNAAVGGSFDGSLTGSFTTNDALSSVTSYDLIASAFGAFTGFEYTNLNSSVTASILPGQFFQLDATAGGNELRLYFTGSLTSSGATIAPAFSYEHENSGGNRFPGGAIVAAAAAVPEPATWGLMMLGFGAIGATLRRRKMGVIAA